jgi:competence protein ComEC
MPSALLTCLLTPIGLGEKPLFVFEKSLDVLINIANTVSSWPGANIWVAHPPLPSFILVVLGGLWLCLWQQPWRRWGLFPIGVGFLAAFLGKPPHLLIDGQGKLVALYEGKTLYLSSTRKGKFTAETWQQYLAAKETKPMPCEDGVCRISIQNTPIIISYDASKQPCEKAAVLIRLEPSQAACQEAALTLDWYDLWRGGGHAVWLTPKGLRLEKVSEFQGRRPWTRKAIHRKDRPMNRKEASMSTKVNSIQPF